MLEKRSLIIMIFTGKFIHFLEASLFPQFVGRRMDLAFALWKKEY
jgi:hypothetical protein